MPEEEVVETVEKTVEEEITAFNQGVEDEFQGKTVETEDEDGDSETGEEETSETEEESEEGKEAESESEEKDEADAEDEDKDEEDEETDEDKDEEDVEGKSDVEARFTKADAEAFEEAKKEYLDGVELSPELEAIINRMATDNTALQETASAAPEKSSLEIGRAHV